MDVGLHLYKGASRSAQIAYEAYREAGGGGHPVTGEPLPSWVDLVIDERRAWLRASLTLRHSVMKEVGEMVAFMSEEGEGHLQEVKRFGSLSWRRNDG